MLSVRDEVSGVELQVASWLELFLQTKVLVSAEPSVVIVVKPETESVPVIVAPAVEVLIASTFVPDAFWNWNAVDEFASLLNVELPYTVTPPW